jgi:predicted transcriptional regulator
MPYTQIENLSDDHRIRLAAAHHLHFERNGAKMEFKAHGVLWGGLPPNLVQALEMLADTHDMSFAELSAKLDGDTAKAQLRQTLAALARAGVVLIERP